MRTRCPACSTTFRVTSEQLRLKAGKVRCGQCLGIFNAFESLIEEDSPSPPLDIETPATAAIAPSKAPTPATETPRSTVLPAVPPPPATEAALPLPETATANPAPPESEVEASVEPAVQEESVEASSQAARAAGLVAARELAETPAYNRWAAGTLAGDSHTRIEIEQSSQPTWPFTLAALILAILLTVQLLHHFRTSVVQRVPEMAKVYALAGVDVPLPRDLELVGIEVSDLQSDNARGLLVLQATLRNRASFAQAWPALELTLTDTHDTVISRRVLQAPDYLPPETNTPAFPGRSDMAIRLWLEAKGIGAAGYRLYLFYP